MGYERGLSEEQMAQLQALEGRVADTDDIPEAPEQNLRDAMRGNSDAWKARKQAISLRIDRDVLDWLRGQGAGYQTTINRILREQMERRGQ